MVNQFMFKKCKHCGFKNPVEVADCLACHKDLPLTVGEFKEGVETVEKMVKGDWSGVAKKSVDDFVGDRVPSLKYRFHPFWWFKVKIHRLKMALINLFWIFAVIGGIVAIGLLYNFLAKIFKR